MEGRVWGWGSIICWGLAADRGELLGYLIKDPNGLILVIDRLVYGIYFQILNLWHDERRENSGE